ncbi:MAG: glycine--tRNA ligase subunit beta, partial [Allosphingosinicella sp.]
VIQLTMRTNQKYFAVRTANGTLAPAFVCTANIDAADGGAAIVAGNEKVLAARLADAKFFWEQDLHVPLEAQAKKLSQIVFHEKLGTVADKVERVAMIAHSLIAHGVVRDFDADPNTVAGLAAQAARLAKADLVTGTVGEFPEVQGIAGGYIAEHQGLPREVAEAIAEHYRPAGQSDRLPTGPVAVAVSLADKFDTIAAFFLGDMAPTGSRDPFALRRAALGILRLVMEKRLRFGIVAPIQLAASALAAQLLSERSDVHEASDLTRPDLREVISKKVSGSSLVIMRLNSTRGGGYVADLDALRDIVRDFFIDRLKVQQREAGVRHDLIDAVFALGGEDDLVRLLARVRALQAFVETPEGADLLAGYKRAANILKKENWEGASRALSTPGSDTIPQTGEEDPLVLVDDPALADAVAAFEERHPEQGTNKMLSYTPEKEEAALIAALDSAEQRARAAVAAEDFEGAMAALASLRAPVDAFFDKVTVNDPDPAKREARLDLLARMRDAVHAVADFSRIEG